MWNIGVNKVWEPGDFLNPGGWRISSKYFWCSVSLTRQNTFSRVHTSRCLNIPAAEPSFISDLLGQDLLLFFLIQNVFYVDYFYRSCFKNKIWLWKHPWSSGLVLFGSACKPTAAPTQKETHRLMDQNQPADGGGESAVKTAGTFSHFIPLKPKSMRLRNTKDPSKKSTAASRSLDQNPSCKNGPSKNFVSS